MKKSVIISALISAMALTANAGMGKQSVNGSSDVSKGSYGTVATSLTSVVGSVATSVESIGKATVTGSKKLAEATMFVIDTPVAASKAGSTSVMGASKYVVTSTGKLLKCTFEGSKMFVKDPSGQISALGANSMKGMEVIIDKAGKMFNTAGDVIVDAYGNDVNLVTNGSGEIFKASSNAVTVTVEKGMSVANFIIVDSAYDSVATSSVNLNMVMEGMSASEFKQALYDLFITLPKNVFEAGTKSGKQYKN